MTPWNTDSADRIFINRADSDVRAYSGEACDLGTSDPVEAKAKLDDAIAILMQWRALVVRREEERLDAMASAERDCIPVIGGGM